MTDLPVVTITERNSPTVNWSIGNPQRREQSDLWIECESEDPIMPHNYVGRTIRLVVSAYGGQTGFSVIARVGRIEQVERDVGWWIVGSFRYNLRAEGLPKFLGEGNG